MTNEKRAFQRLAFSKSSEINAVLVKVGSDEQVEVKVLNVSQGGMGFAAQRSSREKIAEETEFRLERITNGTGLPCLKGQMLKVKWVLNYDQLDNLGVGCEFVDLPENCREEIHSLFSNR